MSGSCHGHRLAAPSGVNRAVEELLARLARSRQETARRLVSEGGLYFFVGKFEYLLD